MTQKNLNIRGLQSALSEAVTALKSLQVDCSVLYKVEELKSELISCFKRGGKLLVFGNGGFAAISQHIAAEFVGKLKIKRNPLPAISLVSDVAVLTCEANDFGYEKIFSRQIEALANPSDVILGLTISGKSKNILEAISTANELGVVSYVLTGANPPTSLTEICKHTIQLPFPKAEIVQDVAMILFHKICEDVEAESVKNCENIWQKVLTTARAGHFNWLILDRDGVVNELLPNDYATKVDDVILNHQFLECCKDLSLHFKGIFVVTNQACIGKGLATIEQIKIINDYIDSEICKYGGKITKFYICPDAKTESLNRKPNTGLANLIKQQYPEIVFSETIVVGDSYSDSLFASRIGASFIKINNV